MVRRLALLALTGAACIVAPSAAGERSSRADLVVGVEGLPRDGVAALVLAGSRVRTARTYPVGRARAFALSPDGHFVAYTTLGSNVSNSLRVLDLGTGRSRTLARGLRSGLPAAFGQVAWSPGGDAIAVTRGPELIRAAIEIRDARTGRLRRSFAVSARVDSRIAWTRDGRTLVFAAAQSVRSPPRLVRLRVRTGRAFGIGVRGFDPSVGPSGLAYSAAGGIRILRATRSVRLAGTRPGDRSPVWVDGDRALVLERPIGACPRAYVSVVCSHVFAVRLRGSPALRPLVPNPARAPAAR